MSTGISIILFHVESYPIPSISTFPHTTRVDFNWSLTKLLNYYYNQHDPSQTIQEAPSFLFSTCFTRPSQLASSTGVDGSAVAGLWLDPAPT